MKAGEFLEKLEKLDFKSLEGERGVGKILSQNVQDFLQSVRFKNLKNDFKELDETENGVEILTSKNANLNGKTVVITGTFEVSREALSNQLEQAGFKVVGSISKNTDYLLCGQNAGSKLDKAEKLGVKIVKNIEEIL